MRYRLKDIFNLQMGKTPARQNMKYWDKSDCKWISIADLSRSEKYISNTKEKISDIAVKETGIRAIPTNTVIMSFKLSIGKVAITADNMYSNEAIMAFNDKHVVEMLPEYIFYMFKYMRWDSGSNNAVMGKTLNKATISEIEIDICSIKKQQEIVAILDKMDNILSNKYKEVYLLDELVKARFVEMFGNPLHPNKYLKLGKIAILERGRFSPRPRNDPKYFNGEYPFIQTGDISSSNHRLSEYKQTLNEQGIKVSKKFCVGTIVMAIVGATIGATAILEREVYAPDSVIGITPYNYNNVFLETLLQFWQPQLLANAPECARSNINLAILGEVPIIDVDVVLQNQFADFVNQVNKSKLQVYQYMMANQRRHRKSRMIRQQPEGHNTFASGDSCFCAAKVARVARYSIPDSVNWLSDKRYYCVKLTHQVGPLSRTEQKLL